MVLFQTGPVQEFIQTARKTQDFWSGSFLLSFLNAKAIHAFGDSDVIFPDTRGCGIYKTVTESLPWIRAGDPDRYVPSIPNRFFAVTDDHPKNRLEKAASTVSETWGEIADRVRDVIEKHLKGSPGKHHSSSLNTRSHNWTGPGENAFFTALDSDLWNEQIQSRAFKTLYVWREIREKEHSVAYYETEALLGARKSTRFFEALPAQEGYQCSLCGLRTALNPTGCQTRSDLRGWWEKVMRGKSLTYRFREGEHLCAVCTVKRLAPFSVFKAENDIPSTSTISAISFQKDIQDIFLKGEIEKDAASRLRDGINTFRGEAAGAAEQIKEPAHGNLPPFFQPNERLLEIDGDWFFDSFYEHPDRRTPTGKAYHAWKNLEKRCVRELGIRVPSKYFALLMADGDSMGEILSDVKDKEDHRDLSGLLTDFAVKKVRKVLEKDRPGYILYWGGDEGVAMLPLEDLFNALTALRNAWHDEVETKITKFGIKKATLSAGVVIVHHQHPLRSAIRELHETVEKAKDMESFGQSKNAWAVNILRRSGGPVLARAHWEYKDDFQPLTLLNSFQEAYRQGWLSPAWLSDLEAEKKALADPPPEANEADKEECWKNAREIFEHEAERLLRRHADVGKDKEKNDKLDEIVSGIQYLNTAVSRIPPMRNFQRHRDICAVLGLANYVAKGGGR